MARRRRKYTWFPTLGTDLPNTNDWCGRSFFQDVDPGGNLVAGVHPLVPDIPLEGGDVTQIQQSLEQEYVIERIVGKVHATLIPQDTPEGGFVGLQQIAAARVTCGFFVARANSDVTVGDANLPVGGGGVPGPGSGQSAEYNPAHVKQIREPWIWRRTWILSQSGQVQINSPAQTNLSEGLAYPSTTAGYGSVHDGPHLDSKVGRRIGNDDRLWFAIATQAYPVGTILINDPVPLVTSTVRVELDYRVLGALRRPRGRSAF